MRLIDADLLKKVIHSAYSDDLEILDKIDELPTAFDINKVIRELNDWIVNVKIDVGNGTLKKQKIIAAKNAINIVKGRGLHENI